MDLFSTAAEPEKEAAKSFASSVEPLPWRMRPRMLSEYVGQEHLLGEGQLINRQLATGRIGSLILYGPPGCGKTALAHLIARELSLPFCELNAVTAGVAEIRKVVADATRTRAASGAGTLLFIDEIHRFNKPQQSALLPHLEQGLLTLIGASTQNPFFAIIPPLASRSHIAALVPHTADQIRTIVERALADAERGLGGQSVTVADDALEFLVTRTEGDARRALNALDVAVRTTGPNARGRVQVTLKAMEESLGEKAVVYEDGDAHYDTISAYIKSIRGSDPDAALYWLAKMLEGGEDPLFIARRLVIAASEDIGNADPRALTLAMSTHQAVTAIGLPEGRIPLAQATVYLALAPKSNASYKALNAAQADVKGGMVLPVPTHLRDKSYAGAKRLGNGKGYKYPHDYPGHVVAQDYLGADRTYFHPTDQGFDARLSARMKEIDTLKKNLQGGARPPET